MKSIWAKNVQKEFLCRPLTIDIEVAVFDCCLQNERASQTFATQKEAPGILPLSGEGGTSSPTGGEGGMLA